MAIPLRHKFLLCAMLEIFFTHNLCLGAADPDSPAQWFYSLPQEKLPLMMHNIAIISSTKEEKIEFVPLDANVFHTDTFWQLISSEEFSFAEKINTTPNQDPPPEQSSSNKKDIFNLIFETTYADTILVVPKKSAKWTLYVKDLNNKAISVFSEKKPTKTDPAAVKSWLKEKIGYSGIVLAHRDKLLLVAVNQPPPSSRSALLFSNSKDLNRIDKKKSEGAAVLGLVKCELSLCIFETTIGSKESVTIGGKVIF